MNFCMLLINVNFCIYLAEIKHAPRDNGSRICKSWYHAELIWTKFGLKNVLQICAVRADERDWAEAQLRHRRRASVSSVSKSLFETGDEEAFVTQLVSRAEALDTAFQEQIVEAVRRLCSATENGCACRVSTANLDNTSHASFLLGTLGVVSIHAAAIKSAARIREKLLKYLPPHPKGRWPLSANILDPVRASIVCDGGAGAILRVVSWFVGKDYNTEGSQGKNWGGPSETGLPVVRVKNKFGTGAEIEDGYRDVSLSVVFAHEGGLAIVGEIQVHDARIFELKRRVSYPSLLSSHKSTTGRAMQALYQS